MTDRFVPRFFNPAISRHALSDPGGRTIVAAPGMPAYAYSSAIVLAVNVALATHRPLLLAGSPGTGKTSLASNVAQVLGWRMYTQTITSRTRARDLMWTFDTLRRLSDAQASAHSGGASMKPREAYVEPMALWWAFDPASAAWRGAVPGAAGISPATDPSPVVAAPSPDVADPRVVLLLDEIDKAEPDLPNDLLEALDQQRFKVDDIDPPRVVQARDKGVLTFITTNGERELPPAFMRRCIVLKLEAPTEDWLVSIANARFGAQGEPLHRAIAKRVAAMRDAAVRQNLREPSTAEYLDALAACRELGIDQSSPQWQLLEQAVLWKRDEQLPGDR